MLGTNAFNAVQCNPFSGDVPFACQQGLQNFGLSSILATYMRGLESEGVEWGAELRELRFQAAWRNTQWDCEVSERCG